MFVCLDVMDIVIDLLCSSVVIEGTCLFARFCVMGSKSGAINLKMLAVIFIICGILCAEEVSWSDLEKPVVYFVIGLCDFVVCNHFRTFKF